MVTWGSFIFKKPTISGIIILYHIIDISLMPVCMYIYILDIYIYNSNIFSPYAASYPSILSNYIQSVAIPIIQISYISSYIHITFIYIYHIPIITDTLPIYSHSNSGNLSIHCFGSKEISGLSWTIWRITWASTFWAPSWAEAKENPPQCAHSGRLCTQYIYICTYIYMYTHIVCTCVYIYKY